MSDPMGRAMSDGGGLSSSSSGLIRDDLLNQITSLRAELANTQLQLHAAQLSKSSSSSNGPSTAAPAAFRRERRTSSPAIHSATAAGLGISTASSQSRPGSRASATSTAGPSRPPMASRHPSSPQFYVGAPPSSLATPPTSSSNGSGLLRRDEAYDDLRTIMSNPTPSPSSRTTRKASLQASYAQRPGIAINGGGAASSSSGSSSMSPLERRRGSHSTEASSDGGRSVSGSSKIPIPMIPKGSVGTATTLAGGASPRNSPQSQGPSKSRGKGVSPSAMSEGAEGGGEEDDSYRFEGPEIRLVPQNGHSANVLRDATKYQQLHSSTGSSSYAEGDDDDSFDIDNFPHHNNENVPPVPSAASLGLPVSGFPRSVSPIARMSSKMSTESESTVVSKENEAKLRSAGSPFFGGSGGAFTERHAARVASSQSGTTKVIMTLQNELTNARSQLESTRSQLRVSARAVESLTRLLEDAKESKERQRLELASLQTTLQRRERMLEETLSRARTAEGGVKQLEDEKKVHSAECSRKAKELEGRVKEAEERKARAEAEYSAMKGVNREMSEGWKREMKAVKKELGSLRLKGERDVNEAKTRQAAVAKLVASRNAHSATLTTSQEEVNNWRTALGKAYATQIANLAKGQERQGAENDRMALRTKEVREELEELLAVIRRYDGSAAERS